MRWVSANLSLDVDSDPTYRADSADNVRSYDRVIALSEPYNPSSAHSIECLAVDGDKRSCLLLASGGATGVHSHSLAICGGACFLAVGDSVVAFELPSLEVLWHRKVDDATCFGVYYVADSSCLIVHGELEVSRLSLDGSTVWSFSGEDIFTGAFSIQGSELLVADFNGRGYKIMLQTGREVA